MQGTQLDDYLAAGWYRMGSMVFTTNYLKVDINYNKVHWLRYPISTFTILKKHKQLLQYNAAHTYTIQPLAVDDSLEKLYNDYKAHVSFETYDTLDECLNFNLPYGNNQLYHYNSLCIKVYNGSSLIAAGILDYGNNSLAGIINFYDPKYSKYSLGKYLMLRKLLYAKDVHKMYYYTGYIVDNYPKFDYKLYLGKQSAQLWNNKLKTWEPMVN